MKKLLIVILFLTVGVVSLTRAYAGELEKSVIDRDAAIEAAKDAEKAAADAEAAKNDADRANASATEAQKTADEAAKEAKAAEEKSKEAEKNKDKDKEQKNYLKEQAKEAAKAAEAAKKAAEKEKAKAKEAARKAKEKAAKAAKDAKKAKDKADKAAKMEDKDKEQDEEKRKKIEENKRKAAAAAEKAAAAAQRAQDAADAIDKLLGLPIKPVGSLIESSGDDNLASLLPEPLDFGYIQTQVGQEGNAVVIGSSGSAADSIASANVSAPLGEQVADVTIALPEPVLVEAVICSSGSDITNPNLGPTVVTAGPAPIQAAFGAPQAQNPRANFSPKRRVERGA